MNIQTYINRIDYTGDLTPSLEVLKDLQKSHLLKVPFENLDIHYNKGINLKVGTLYEKIVENRRGGFCYELNGLFVSLLRALGFNSKLISARVYDSNKDEYGKEFDHLAIIVELDQVDYLVDVGFGEFAFQPLKLELDSIQNDPRGSFVIEKCDNEYFRVSKTVGDTWMPEYIFTTKARDLSEFTTMCNYHQTSPDSHFTHKKLITKPTAKGRITITGNTLKVTEEGKTIVDKKLEDNEFEMYVQDWFDIDLLKK